jgi:hypothetical protein
MLTFLFTAALAASPPPSSTTSAAEAKALARAEAQTRKAEEEAAIAASLPEDGSRPKWHQLPPNPRGQTDFTAYTLDWGEVRVGIGNVGISLLPGLQLSTQPIFDALRMPNLALKANLLQIGPHFDGAINGAMGVMRTDSVNALYVVAGGTASVILNPHWSVHAGGTWIYAAAVGEPDLVSLADTVDPYVEGEMPSDATLSYLGERLAYEVRAEAVTIRLATDVRLNRRDSIILQGQAAVWAWTQVPDYAERFVHEDTGFLPFGDSYTASLAWQFSWRNVDLRVGAGVSSVPGAWLMNTVDLAWRFGGETRGEQGKRLRAWRQAKPDGREQVASR